MFLYSFACKYSRAMYTSLIFLHSLTRWLVVISLAYAAYRAYTGYRGKKIFSRTDNAIRHWTATIAHIQLLIGMLLYTQSHVTKYFWKNTKAAIQYFDVMFYSLLHSLAMLIAIVMITVGSAMAKRKPTDEQKFKTMFAWFTIALIIILIAIPWPFSPFSKRPYLR